eukprot:12017757-Alexandrium_andersonii.AAC.1
MLRCVGGSDRPRRHRSPGIDLARGQGSAARSVAIAGDSRRNRRLEGDGGRGGVGGGGPGNG